MYTYIAYGFNICSELELPDLIETKGRADIGIKCRKLDLPARTSAGGEADFWASDSEVYIFNANIGTFRLRQGCEIIVDPVPGVDERLLRLYLQGRVLGALLHQRGMLVLHGSAVAFDGIAVAFLGYSGSGKSTAAASMNAKDCPIVADDLVVIDVIDNTPMVYPAFPKLKLWPEVAESLGYKLDALPYVNPKTSKRTASLALGFSLEPLPLRRIYILEKGGAIEIQRLGLQESMIELVRCSYAIRSLNAGSNLSPHFSQCVKVTKGTSVCRLIRPFDLKSLPDFAHAVEEDAGHG